MISVSPEMNYWLRSEFVLGGTEKKIIKLGQKLSKCSVEVKKLVSKVMVVKMKICSGIQFMTKEE